jgi:hypothetical protein
LYCSAAHVQFSRLFTLLFCLATTQLALGQSKTLSISAAPAGLEVKPYFKEKQLLAQKLFLANLQTSNDAFHFRFWTIRQVLDIWTMDFKSYSGSVTNYAQRYSSTLLRQGRYQVDTVFSNRVAVDSSKARQIFHSFEALVIADIPSDDVIPGWNRGLDGIDYSIELTQKGQYSFKTYWTPDIFVASLPEAKRIQTFIDKLYDDYKLLSYARPLLNATPGTYEHNGIPGVQIQAIEERKTRKHSIWDWF